MKSVVILSLALSLGACCKKHHHFEPNTNSACINEKISIFSQSSSICDSTATVKAYTFQNDTVYVFDVGFCYNDFALPVLNTNCDTLGYLGGVQGNYIINGQSFDAAVYQSTIWSN